MLSHVSRGACYNPGAMKPSAAAPRYWLSWLGIGVMRTAAAMPLSVQFAIGNLLGRAFYVIARRRRHIAATNIALCFPELGQRERTDLLKAAFRSTGISAMETAIAWFNPIERYRSRVIVEGIEHLQDAQRRGRGVLLIGAHFSTLDLAGALLSLFTEVDVMYRRTKNPVFERSMVQGRKRHFDGVIERSDTRTILRRIKNNRTIWYAADQDYGRKHSVFAPFFGQCAATITAASRLAKLNGSAALFLSHFRDEKSRTWSLHITPILEDFPSQDEREDAMRINNLIEREIRRHPEQYLWMHRRFKTRPDGQHRPY